MNEFRYFIYKISSRPDADGRYLGPYASESDRDAQVAKLRTLAIAGRVPSHYFYRVNIEASVADRVTGLDKTAA